MSSHCWVLAVLELLGFTSLVQVYFWRFDSVSAIVQIIVFALMRFAIPFAVWAGVQLYVSRGSNRPFLN